MTITTRSRSRIGKRYLMAAIVGGALALPLSLAAQTQSHYDFNHLELGPLDQRDGWSPTASTANARIHMTAPSGLYQGGHALGLDGVANTYIGARAGIPDFAGANSITAEVFLGPDNGRIVRVFGIVGVPYQHSYAGIIFGATGNNNFGIRGAGFLGGSAGSIASQTWAESNTWYRLTFSWSEPDGSGNRDVVLYGYDLTNRRLIGDRGKILEANVTSSFFGPDPSNYIGFGVRVDGDGEGTAMVHSVRRTGQGTFPLAANFGGARFLDFLDQSYSAPLTVGTVAVGEPFYMDTADTVTTLPAGLAGSVALKTVNDFSGQAHQFDGRSDFVRLEGTREEFQHFLRGEGKATFRVNYDSIPATGYHYSRSFFVSANGNIQADHVDFNVGVSQLGNWWVSLSSGAGGQNYVVLEMDITPKPEPGVWYDVVVDLNAGTFSVNGEVLRTFTPANTIPAGGEPVLWQNDFHFGFTPNNISRRFNGQLTEVKFEDGAGNVTGHWRLDQADDYVVADLSGNGHDGTVSGRARPLEDLSPYIGFAVDRPTTVYVAYDQNAIVPAWLQNHFTLSGQQVATTAGGFNLWERAVAAHEDVSLLFDNTAWQNGDNNYWVILDEDGAGVTDWPDAAFLRTGPESTWRLDDHYWTLAADSQSALGTQAMVSSIDNFDPAQGFKLAANVRVPSLQEAGNNAIGFLALGEGDNTSTGIRAEWLPRAAGGLSSLQLVDSATGTVLAQSPWTGLAPTAVDNNAGLANPANEVLFQEGTPAFTGGGALLSEGFETGGTGWTTGSYNATATQWEIGTPGSGPWTAHSGSNVAATRLGGKYDAQSQSWLRSPPVDLTGISDARLTFFEWSDVDTFVENGEFFHYAMVSVLDADTLAPIQELARYSEDISAWQEREFDLSAFAGQRIVVEFAFYSDELMDFAGDGWYLDEIEITQLPRNIAAMPEALAPDGTLFGIATDNAGVSDTSENYLQFTVADRATGGNAGLTVFVAWDSRAAGLEPNWLRDNFTLTDHVVEISDGTAHRLWAREYADGATVTLGGASAAGGGPILEGTSNYFVLFGDARPGLDTIYTLTAEGIQVDGQWDLSFSLTDNAGTTGTVSTTSGAALGGNSFGLFARHPDSAGGSVVNGPIWELFDLSLDFLNESDLLDFEAWRAEHFAGQLGNPEISGPDASPAGDGVTNLMKYALDLSPWIPVTSADLPQFSLDGEGGLVLMYWERTDINDIDYIPEVSEDLVIWNSGAPHVVEFFREAGGEPNIEDVGVVGEVSPGAGSGFVRLRVEQRE